MTPEQWQQVKDEFERLVELPASERKEQLSRIPDPEVADEVARLIELHHRGAENFDRLQPGADLVRGASGLHTFFPGLLAAGRFRIVHFIAAGGMGEVYEAHDENLQETVALKVIRPDRANQAHALARFKKELQLARLVSHPNVCRVYDIFQFSLGGRQVDFFTMEFLKGDTLAARLAGKGRLTVPEATPLIRQVINGLNAAHSAGVVHRDLKTGNVMLVPGPAGEPRAVITDFGLSQNTTPGDSSTLAGSGAGTPAYMAPEQIEGGSSGPAADIYALGVVMYEMLAGSLPFDAPSPMAMAVQKVRDTARPPSSACPDLSKKWDDVILRCLAKDPRDRFGSATDVWRAIEGEAIRRRRRIPVRVLAGGMAVLLLALAFFVWTGRSRAQPEAVRRYEEGISAYRDGATYRANKLFALAVSIDGDYAPAHARLAETWTDLDYSDRAGEELVRTTDLLKTRHLTTSEKDTVEAARATVMREHERAVNLHRKIAESADTAGAWFDLGRAQERAESPTAARASYEKALARSTGHAAAHMRLGILDGRAQQVQSALNHFEQAAKTYQATSDYEGQAEVLLQRGGVLIHNNAAAKGEPDVQQAYERARSNGNLAQQVQAMTQLSSASIFSGDAAGARRRMEEPLRLALENGLESLAATALVDLGNTFLTQYQLNEAEEYFMRALEMSKRFKLSGKQAMASLSLASIATRRDRPEVVLAYAVPAVAYYRDAGYRRNRNLGQTLICQALIQLGRLDEAESIASAELSSAATGADVNQKALWMETRAYAETLRGSLVKALEDYRSARGARRQAGRKQEEAYAALNEADLLSQLGDSAGAMRILEEQQPGVSRLDAGVQTRWYIVSARQTLRSGQKERAAVLAREGLKIRGGKSDARTRILKAVACIAGSGRGAPARECGEMEALIQTPGIKLDAEFRMLLAECWASSGQNKRAVKAFTDIAQQATGVNPELRYRALTRSGQSPAEVEPELEHLLGSDQFANYKRRTDLLQVIH